MPNLISVAAWAKTLGISRQSAHPHVKRLGIPIVDGKIDADYATALYKKNTRQRVNENKHPPPDGKAPASGAADRVGIGGGDAPDEVPAYDVSRARREAAEATKAEIEAAKLADTFLDKADVDACMFEVARAMRDGLMNCARRIAADVASLTTADECEAVIETEHRTLLESMAHTLAEKLGVKLDEHEE
jgi:hypothetical protein